MGCLTAIRSVNKSNVAAVAQTFGSVRSVRMVWKRHVSEQRMAERVLLFNRL